MKVFNSNTTKLLTIILITAFVFESSAGLYLLFEPKPAEALLIGGSLGGAAEGDVLEMNCGGLGGAIITGLCVPTQIEADIMRGFRNVKKNFWTILLYALSGALGQWLTGLINNKLKIRDYYGYNRSLKDILYRYRILFENYLDPTTRELVDIAYDSVARGGISYSRVGRAVEQYAKDTLGFPLPTKTPRGGTAPIFFQDMEFFAKGALSGQENTQAADWYFNFQEQGMALQSQANQASAQEVSNAEGYKSTRLKADLDKLAPGIRTPPFYQGSIINPRVGLIQAPGSYGARVVQVTVQRLLNKDYLPTSVIEAMVLEAAQWGFFRLFSGGLFGSGSQAVGGQNQGLGNPTSGEEFYKDPTSRTDTGDGACGGNTVPDPANPGRCIPN
ncbi:MAG: hypothetical protein HY397_03115 [Candidatus Doudnabacteria bacterium]|nr:hypothetical protein [Candidatus Doudnabacteria bacterium]